MGGSANDEPWLALGFNFFGHFKLAKAEPCFPLEAGTQVDAGSHGINLGRLSRPDLFGEERSPLDPKKSRAEG